MHRCDLQSVVVVEVKQEKRRDIDGLVLVEALKHVSELHWHIANSINSELFG